MCSASDGSLRPRTLEKLRARFSRIEPKSCRIVLKWVHSIFERFTSKFVFESVFESCKELRNLPITLLGKKRFTKKFTDTKEKLQNEVFRFEQLGSRWSFADARSCCNTTLSVVQF